VVLGRKQAVQYYIISAVLGVEDSDVIAWRKIPLLAVGDADCVV